MSISNIQKKRIFNHVSRALYASGERPRLIDIATLVGEYFARYPAGNPLPIPEAVFRREARSSAERMNQLLAHTNENLDVLYENAFEHTQELMLLYSIVNTHLERLRTKRSRLIAKLDDYMLALLETDGYFYNTSDSFADISLTDISLTTAFIDVEAGAVTLPFLSGRTKVMPSASYGNPTVNVTLNDLPIAHTELMPFSGAIDGLTNTVWGVQVQAPQPGEVVCTVTLPIGRTGEPVSMSRFEFDPHTISPVQLWMHVRDLNLEESQLQSDDDRMVQFGGQIRTSISKIVLHNEPIVTNYIKLTLRKTQPDYEQTNGNTKSFHYIFGAKELQIIEEHFDRTATFVSKPLSLPTDLEEEAVIDAVALAVELHNPLDTSTSFYVAAEPDTVDNPDLSDFDWRPINPIDALDYSEGEQIVRFDGAATTYKNITSAPTGSDLELIPLDSTNSDPTKRNPTVTIIEGSQIYRIAAFDTKVLTESVKLEEGINSTRIYYTEFTPSAVEGLDYWADVLNGDLPSNVVYGRIDTGNEFFYGGDIGDSSKSVYVEAYIDCDREHEVVLRELRKADVNAELWEVRAYLNGAEMGFLPVGTDSLNIPWRFREGRNHIILLINIPPTTESSPNSYLGTLELMGGDALFNYGAVRLDTWQHVDLFHMQHNEVGEPKTFTIHNGEIISRRKPSTDFRLRYATATGEAPDAVRLRVDMSRSIDNSTVSPLLSGYRLKFAYGDSNA